MEGAAAVGAFVLITFICLALGYRVVVPYKYYQLLDADWLERRLAESLWYLHWQPPLLNLFLGIFLKLQAATGVRVESIIFAAHLLMGCAGVASLSYVSRFLIPNTTARWAFMALIILHPVLYMTFFEYFYTYLETVLLAVGAAGAAWFLGRKGTLGFVLFCAATLALVYTRAIFHFVWAGTLLLFVYFAAKKNREEAAGASRRIQAAILGVSLVLLAAWPAKNFFLFNSFTYSTWSGCNLVQGLDLAIPLIGDSEKQIPERFAAIPALTQENKNNGSPNFNYYPAIGNCGETGREAFSLILREPQKVIRKAAENYWYMTRFSGRHPYELRYGSSGAVPGFAERWMRLYEMAVFQDFRNWWSLGNAHGRGEGPSLLHLSGFFLLLPAIMIGSILKVFKSWRVRPAQAKLALCLWVTILWVMAMILFVDGAEGNRMRFSSEPYLWLLGFWAIARAQRVSVSGPALDHE